jgi:hypothetical protein
MDSHFYIPNVQATIVASFSSMNTPCTSPYFLNLLFPLKWFKREVRKVWQCLLVFLKKIYPFSSASIALSKDLMLWIQKSSKQRILKDMNRPWQRHVCLILSINIKHKKKTHTHTHTHTKCAQCGFKRKCIPIKYRNMNMKVTK